MSTQHAGRDWPIIDAHCHLRQPGLTAEDLIEMMDEAGIDQAVVFPSAFCWSLPSKDNYYCTNDYIAEVQHKYPDRLIGFAMVNPRHRGCKELGMPNLAVNEFERCIKELGLKGLKIHPEQHYFSIETLIDSELMASLVRLQRETHTKIPIISHGMTSMGTIPDQFGRLASKYPDVPIIIAHAAGYQSLSPPISKELARANRNLFADTAMATIDDAYLINTARTIGADRVIFGSDHTNRAQKNSYGNFLYIIERAFPDMEERKRILGGNIAEILGYE